MTGLVQGSIGLMAESVGRHIGTAYLGSLFIRKDRMSRLDSIFSYPYVCCCSYDFHGIFKLSNDLKDPNKTSFSVL